ncbi:MAG: peptidylprolyl isomerase [Planctomycetota bacterium]|nr:peptidylprolyl isomerase [Planctomycetota bacterium]
MRKWLVISAAAVWLAGCSPDSPPPPGPNAPTAATSRPVEQKQVMATVNGESIYMDELNDLLVRSHGLPMARQLIANELVRQAAGGQNITVTDQEVQTAKDRALEQIFGAAATGEHRQKLLAQFLDRYSISRRQWTLTMQRNVLLAKLAEPRVSINEQELRDAFGDKYGRKVVVRHIQTASLADAQQVISKLADGADFAELVKSESTNQATAKNGGQMEPIGTKQPNIPPAMRQAALGLKTPGELSEPVQVGTTFHLLKLMRVIEPQDVKFEDVKQQLTTELRDRKLRAMQQRVFQELLGAAKIEYVNPHIKEQADMAEGPQP